MSSLTPPPLGFSRPEIPTLVPEPASGKGWVHETKYEGFRRLIAIDCGKVRAFARNGEAADLSAASHCCSQPYGQATSMAFPITVSGTDARPVQSSDLATIGQYVC